MLTQGRPPARKSARRVIPRRSCERPAEGHQPQARRDGCVRFALAANQRRQGAARRWRSCGRRRASRLRSPSPTTPKSQCGINKMQAHDLPPVGPDGAGVPGWSEPGFCRRAALLSPNLVRAALVRRVLSGAHGSCAGKATLGPTGCGRRQAPPWRSSRSSRRRWRGRSAGAEPLRTRAAFW